MRTVHPRIAICALVAVVTGLFAGPSAASASTLLFTTAADRDVYSVKSDGSGLKRLTRTTGSKDLEEDFPTARKGVLMFQTRVNRSSAVLFGGIWHFATGSHYELVRVAKRKATLPLYRRYTARSVPNSRRYMQAAAPALAPKGTMRVAFNCKTPKVKSELCLYNFKSRKVKRLTNCDCVEFGGSPTRVSWSRNGRYLAFAAPQALYRFDLARNRLARVFDATRHADTASEFYDHATIDPTGTKIAVRYSDGASASGIRIVDLATNRRTRYPSPEFEIVDMGGGDLGVKAGAHYAAPSFSPNGRELAITVADDNSYPDLPREQPTGLYVIDLATSTIRQILHTRPNDFTSTGMGWSVTWGS